MIPAEKWPEGADRHCWDADGDGHFYGIVMEGEMWTLLCEPSYIDMPEGHDWRVPVMRPTVKESLTVDLEQFRDAVEFWIAEASKLPNVRVKRPLSVYGDRLLAMIDGQKGVS